MWTLYVEILASILKLYIQQLKTLTLKPGANAKGKHWEKIETKIVDNRQRFDLFPWYF